MNAMTREAMGRLLAGRRALARLRFGVDGEGPVSRDGLDAEWPELGTPPGGDLGARHQRELAEIEAALGRIAEGRFGFCECCDGPVGRGRMIAVPQARLCLDCGDARAPGHAQAPEPAAWHR